MADSKKNSSSISDAIIIAAFPPIAYLFAFIYEAGYAHVFSIPLELITLTLTNVFIAAGSLLLVGLLLLILLDLISMILGRLPSPLGETIAVFLPMLLASIALALYALGTPLIASLRAIGLVWLVALFLQFVFPLISQPTKKTYLEKLAAQSQYERSGFLAGIAKRFKYAYLFVYCLGLALWVTFFAGQSAAFRQRYFLTTQGDTPCIVLRVYGDRAICAPLETATHQVMPNFVLIQLDAIDDQKLTLESISPLADTRHPLPSTTPAVTNISTGVAIPTEQIAPSASP